MSAGRLRVASIAIALETSFNDLLVRASRIKDPSVRIAQIQGLKIKARSGPSQPPWVVGFCNRADRLIMVARGEAERARKIEEIASSCAEPEIADESAIAA